MVNIKSLFFGLLILTVGTATYGQTNKFDIGVEGSPSLIFLRSSNKIINKLYKPTIGFSGGLFFQFNFKKIISLRTNIAYERKGSVLTADYRDENNNPLDVTPHINFDYLTLPILVRATFGKKVQFFVNAGPYFGYLIKQTIVSKGDNFPTTITNNTIHYDRFDIGISTGLGLFVPIKTKFAVSFEVRNNLGLYNVSKTKVTNYGTKTNSTNLLFGFTYKLG